MSGRRLAARFVGYAARLLPGPQSPWARAMESELDYIGDDPAALRWALGCILASCKIRLAHWPWFSAQTVRRCALSGAGLIFLGVVSFEGYASGQTMSSQVQFDGSFCGLMNASSQIHSKRALYHHGKAGRTGIAGHPALSKLPHACKMP